MVTLRSHDSTAYGLLYGSSAIDAFYNRGAPDVLSLLSRGRAAYLGRKLALRNEVRASQ